MRSLLYFLLFVVFLHSPPAIAEGVDKSWRSTPQGDYGYFATSGDPQGHVMYLVPDDQNALVSRWRSSYGNKYRLWTDTERLVVGLKTRADFDSAKDNFGNREDQGRHWCEVVENPWNPWAYSALTDECGTHTATRTRTCTTGGKYEEKPCADTCPNAFESETFAVVNPPCETCNTDIYLAPDGSTREVFAQTCPVGEFFTATNCVGNGIQVPCAQEPACNTDIYLGPDGSPWHVFAAQCPVGNFFTATNCEGNGIQVPCEQEPACNTNIYLGPDGSPWQVFAAQCPIGESFMSTNCVDDKRPRPCDGPAVCDADSFSNYQSNVIEAYPNSESYFHWVNDCGEYKAHYVKDVTQTCTVTMVDVVCTPLPVGQQIHINTITFPAPKPAACPAGSTSCYQY